MSKFKSPSRRTVLLFCGLMSILLWFSQVTPYLNVADDSGRYMVLGEAIARTGDLRLISAPGRPLDTLYPPGFPVIIALCLLITGSKPSGVVILVKVIQLLLLLCTLPMMERLMKRARLAPLSVNIGLLLYALSPTLISYANEVMSEMPLLFLSLSSVLLVEKSPKSDSDDGHLPSYGKRILSLALAAIAFTMRTSGIALLLAQFAWFWKRFGRIWGLIALSALLLPVGIWLARNHYVAATHPQIHYATYLEQFTLRNPMKPGSGRISLSPLGLLSRMKFGIPTYIGMIPRAVLYMMAPPGSPALMLFYLVAVPLTALIFVGLVEVWRRGLFLSCGFSALFWFTAAMWPWQNARFIVPILPFLLLFTMAGSETAGKWIIQRAGLTAAKLAGCAGMLLILTYYGSVHLRVIHADRDMKVYGYRLGRTAAEGGFYSACSWLHAHAAPGSIVMGKPPYLLHLYSGMTTVQIEPDRSPRNLEIAYIEKERVQYILEDSWQFGAISHRLLGLYFQQYGNMWRLVWQDPLGSGVNIWERTSSF